MSGLTEAARKVRRKKNMVGMKFNLVNFVLETISILLLLAVKSDVIRILYLLVSRGPNYAESGHNVNLHLLMACLASLSIIALC